ncbi:MAG TPA: hypothetical protein PK364_12485 [Synergistaceae bacterium]|nr:hypothetical protein [Synergistaceae bacterium]
MDVLKWEPYRIGVEDIVANLRFLEDIKEEFIADQHREIERAMSQSEENATAQL